MKKVLLVVVVLCALSVAGIGGVFADYQDIETIGENDFETGSLDLLVSDSQGTYWEDPDVPRIISSDNFMPECEDKSYHFDLHNAGVYTQGTGWVYFHIKNAIYSDNGRTEPENAVELGLDDHPIGELANGTFVYSPGWGANLDELGYHMEVDLYTRALETDDWVAVNLDAYDLYPTDGKIKFNELVCNQILICELGSLESVFVKFDLWFQDIPEEHIRVDLNLFPGTDGKFNDWPTNALQDDQVDFDISFELFQFKLPPPS